MSSTAPIPQREIIDGVIQTRAVPSHVPTACPVCKEAGYRDTDWGSVSKGVWAVRIYDCGLQWVEETGRIDLPSNSHRHHEIMIRHFTRLLQGTDTPFADYITFTGDPIT